MVGGCGRVRFNATIADMNKLFALGLLILSCISSLFFWLLVKGLTGGVSGWVPKLTVVSVVITLAMSVFVSFSKKNETLFYPVISVLFVNTLLFIWSVILQFLPMIIEL